jgi:hypothetical protein
VPTASFRQLYRKVPTRYCLCIVPFLSSWLRYEHGKYPDRTNLCAQNRFTQGVFEQVTLSNVDAWLLFKNYSQQPPSISVVKPTRCAIPQIYFILEQHSTWVLLGPA